MNKFITFLCSIFIATILSAQVPQGMSYQAIANNASGNPVVNGTVSVRITILDNSATGTEVYKETHSKTTNNKGLFNLNIGQGTPVTGTFASINWSTNNKFLKVEIDPAGGTNYTAVGTNQLMSVPYAFVAGKVIGQNNTNTNVVSYKSTAGDGTIVVYTTHEVKGFSLSGWNSASDFTEPIKGAIASNNIVVVYSDHEVKAYSASRGWQSASDFTNTIRGVVASKTSVVVYTDKEVKGYGTTNGWSSGSDFSNTIVGAISGGSGIVVYTDHEVKGFNATNNWASGSDLSGVIKGGAGSGYSVVVYTDVEVKAYNTSTGAWSSGSDFSEPIKGITPSE